MARRKKKLEKLIEETALNMMEAHLLKLARKTKKRAEREKVKLQQYLQLPLIRDEEIIEAQYEEPQPSEAGHPELKKTEDGSQG